MYRIPASQFLFLFPFQLSFVNYFHLLLSTFLSLHFKEICTMHLVSSVFPCFLPYTHTISWGLVFWAHGHVSLWYANKLHIIPPVSGLYLCWYHSSFSVQKYVSHEFWLAESLLGARIISKDTRFTFWLKDPARYTPMCMPIDTIWQKSWSAFHLLLSALPEDKCFIKYIIS